MKPIFNRLILFLLFCAPTLFSQEKPDTAKELVKSYSEYFTLNREAVFLHLNKTVVVPGEELWFSAYVFNPKVQKPHFLTTNLHVNLYNEAGKLMEAQTLFIENGKGSGFFDLQFLRKNKQAEDEKNPQQRLNYPPGKYLIKASTKYMENFREDLSFSQSFTILGDTTQTGVQRKYDLQLLPEGGHLVANVSNTVGVKLIDNTGKGVFFTDAKVLNTKKRS